MSIEVELKLAMDEVALRALPKLPIIAKHSLYKPVTRRLLSTYFDTPELALRQRGIAVRLRRDGRRSLQTIKQEGSSNAGLHQRREWETPAAQHRLDFTVVDDPELRLLFARGDLQQNLRPVFETDFRRTQRILKFGADRIELCIDRGEVRADGRSEPICEVELELKAGKAQRLFEVARRINEQLTMRLDPRSKAERGYRLSSGETQTPRKAHAPALQDDMNTEQAFLAIMQSCLAHLQANEVLLSSEDIEYVHQMRVALRRMRSVLSLFTPAIPKRASSALVAELRWLAGELNDARNWDVFVAQTLPPILAAHPQHAGLAWLRECALQQRRGHVQRARAAVASPRYQMLLLSLGSWLSQNAWCERGAASLLAVPASDFAGKVLGERHKALRKRGEHLTEMDSAARHALRIAAKKLRYAAEFFSALYPRREVHAYVSAVATLQDVLGALNDAATTQTLLEHHGAQSETPAPNQAGTRQHALGICLGWVNAQAQRQLSQLSEVWSAYRGVPKFW